MVKAKSMKQVSIFKYFTSSTSKEKQKKVQLIEQQRRTLRKCAQKRWSSLLRRIGHKNGLKKMLGTKRWNEFIDESRSKYEKYLAKFLPTNGILQCIGRIENNETCPNNFRIQIGKDQLRKVKNLHLDHEFDVKQVCNIWRSNISESSDWSGGMGKKLLLWLLFEAVEFRCFNGVVKKSCNVIVLSERPQCFVAGGNMLSSDFCALKCL